MGESSAYHETFDVDGSASARRFVPLVDELCELWDVVPCESEPSGRLPLATEYEMQAGA